MKLLDRIQAVAFLALSLLTAVPAQATDQTDIAVSIKTLPLLTNKLIGNVMVTAIYDPSRPETEADAKAIKSIIDSGLTSSSDINFNSQITSSNALSGLPTTKIAFLAHGMSPEAFKSISTAAASTGVLTICTDIEYVKSNLCTLGIISKPRVEVYYSPLAAENAHISFASAFTMLAKQVGSM